MAEIPDPTDKLTDKDRELFDHMASARAHAEGRSHLGDVYVRMFNNPGVAEKVGALGEHLRFHGSLPDDVRELVILRFASRQKFPYEWSHHQRPAELAGISREIIDALTTGGVPQEISDASQAAIQAVDAILSKKSIPTDVQQRFVNAYGVSGLVEVVAICGLYAIMGYMTTAFDISIEEGLPKPPF